jgi:hypothetical protein
LYFTRAAFPPPPRGAIVGLSPFCPRPPQLVACPELDAFEQRALGEIDSGEWDADEFPLRLTKMHCDFVNLVEAHLESVLSKQGLSCSSFIEKLEDIESREGWTWARDGAKEVIALLLEVDNFSMWGASMKKKAAARQRRQRK